MEKKLQAVHFPPETIFRKLLVKTQDQKTQDHCAFLLLVKI